MGPPGVLKQLTRGKHSARALSCKLFLLDVAALPASMWTSVCPQQPQGTVCRSVSASLVPTGEGDGTERVKQTRPVAMADVGWALRQLASQGPPQSQGPCAGSVWVSLQVHVLLQGPHALRHRHYSR